MLQETIGNNRAGRNNEDGSDHKFKFLGEGSFGKVFLVPGLGGRDVALKVLDATNVLADIQKEIEIHSKLKPHINVIQMYGSFAGSQNMCLVLEYASGTPLCNLKGPLSASTSAKIIRQVIDGLNHIHEYNVMHRDMKPDNIVLDGNNENLKIVDFGSATFFPSQCTKEAGTEEYLAPEMWLEQKHDQRVDTWAVGVILYELLTDKLPFRGENDENVGWSENSKIIWPKEGVLSANSHAGRSLIINLLKEKSEERISLRHVLEHDFFAE